MTKNSKKPRHKTPPVALQIAIIVRTKDRPRLLMRSLQSLAAQNRQPNEIIVINDGGVAVDKIVNEFSHLNLKLITNASNQGRSHAGNQGVNATDCDIIGFLDDDDRFLPDHLQRLETAMLQFDANVAYSGCRLLKRDLLGDTEVLQEQAIGQYNEPYDAQRLSYENYIPLINLLIKRDLWLQVGGFDESFDVFEDWDVLLRLSKHTTFYHVAKLTAEYAIWGNTQITQQSDQDRWRKSYRQFLTKHLLTLPEADKIDSLAEYWRISQERRGILQESQTEQQDNQLKLLQTAQKLEQVQSQLQHAQSENQRLQSEQTQLQSDWQGKYDQLQSDWTHKYEQLQTKYDQLQSDWQSKYDQLQAEYAQLQANWISKYQQLQADSTKEYRQLQAEWTDKQSQQEADSKRQQTKMQETFEQLEADYFELQTATKQERQQFQALQESMHELSKQLVVGINQNALEQILQSAPSRVFASIPEGTMSNDYHRLVAWIRAKIKQMTDLQNQFKQQLQPLSLEYQQLREQLANLIQFSKTAKKVPTRHYLEVLPQIDQQINNLASQTENAISFGTQLPTQLGFNVLNQAKPESTPPARPLSSISPTFLSFAGSPDHLQIMESISEPGPIPFLLDADVALVFTVFCQFDNFCRLDIFLGTLLRINTCQVRLIIRESKTPTIPLRVLSFNAIESLDNHFQTILFEPILDSARKTYQIEIDSPEARSDSCIAVWCHPKQTLSNSESVISELPLLEPVSEPPQPEPIIEPFLESPPATLPPWVQQSLLALPVVSQLNTQLAKHHFMVFGLTETTTELQLHVFLGRLNYALKQADNFGQVVVCGTLHSTLKQYCHQHQVPVLENSPVSLDLAFFLKWGQVTPIKANYYWCCDINALPQPDIVERALEMFAACPEAHLLVPMEKLANGRIRAGYASLLRDGIIRATSAGAPADHPYYSYRRRIEAATSQLVILQTACLAQLDPTALKTYQTPMYQISELIWQLKANQDDALYEAALCYENTQPYPSFTDSNFDEDCQHFYQRWQALLPIQPLLTHLNEILNPRQLPTVLVIDATLPSFDEDSGSLRLYTLLKIWQAMGYRITFFPDNLDNQFKYRHALEALGIEVFHSNYGLADAMGYRQFDFAFICRVEIGQRYIPYVRLLSPKTVIFYDTVDIHYIREQRQAEIENNPELAAHAKTTKRKELANCLLADRTITVTEDDSRHLQTELPNLKCSVIPNIHIQQPLADTGFAQRDGLVFIGNYNHQPNEDAVFYLIEHILPKILARLPDVCLYLIGSNMKDKVKALASEHIKIVGWVDKVEPEFAERRIFVSYLRYGAGMKGKLGQALSVGLPVVTTSIGAEGMGLEEEKTALIADEPETFAEAVWRLYTDSELWERLSRNGRDYIETCYGETAVRNQLKCLLETR